MEVHNLSESQAFYNRGGEYQRANRPGIKFDIMQLLNHQGTSKKKLMPIFYHTLTSFEKCGMQVIRV
jgi:hypothetical protein